MSGPAHSVLVVEDDADVRGALVTILESHGYHVLEAEDGRDALRQLQGSIGVALIVLDLFMPDMNGWAFREEQAKDAALASIPVLVISADPTVGKGGMPGVVDTLGKPVPIERLLEVVAEHCPA